MDDKIKFVNGMSFIVHPVWKDGRIATKYDLKLTLMKVKEATKVLLKGTK